MIPSALPSTRLLPAQTGFENLPVDPSVVANVVLVLVGAYLSAHVVRFVVSGVAERTPRHRIAVKMFVPVASFFIYAAAVYLVLGPLLSVSSTQLLALSGLLGAALGFGLRDLFAGVVGGLVILIERPYQLGDKVEIGDDYGEVTGIGLRATTLTTADDDAVRVPNASLFTSNVSNANDGRPEMLAVVEVSVAPDADIARATTVVEEALITSRYAFVDDDHPVAVRVEDESYYRTIRGKAYVADLRDEFAFSSDVTERSLAAFAEYGIETPEIPAQIDERAD